MPHTRREVRRREGRFVVSDRFDSITDGGERAESLRGGAVLLLGLVLLINAPSGAAMEPAI